MQIKTVKFDVAGAVAAALLNHFHTPNGDGPYLYQVTGSAPMYDIDGCSTETMGVAIGYKSSREFAPSALATVRDMHDLDAPSWVEYIDTTNEDHYFEFEPLAIDKVEHYDPAIYAGVCWSPLNGPDEGFVVTELYPKDVDLTKDGVIKLRPKGMSETDAHKHIGKLPGRIEFTQALTILHRLNYIQQLANITAVADDDEGEE